MKEFKSAILSQNHRRSQGGSPGGPGPSTEMPPMTKIEQKKLVSSFSVSFSNFAYNSTRVQQQLTINDIDDQGARRTPLILFFPTNLKYNQGEIKSFCPKNCYLKPSSKLFTNVMPKPAPYLPYGTAPELSAQMVGLFWSSLMFGRKMLQKSPKCQGPHAM